jgi:glutamine cyclotransferase
MNIPKILSISFLSILMFGCGGTQKKLLPYSLKLSNKDKRYQHGDWAGFKLISNGSDVPEALSFFLDGKALETKGDSVKLIANSLGNKTLELRISGDNNSYKLSEKIKVFAEKGPELYTYTIVNTYPHDINAYTQGLEFYKDTLYESTGLRGFSSLRKVDFKTGKVLKKLALPDAIFGEGITILNNRLYMLSWQSGKGFVFDPATFKELSQFSYGQSKEGWGLCNDGKKLFKSDGSQKIWFLDPQNLSHIELATNKSFFKNTNELEYVNGLIYANVYQKESVMVINATSGAIEGVVNFAGLKKRVTPHSEIDVLNGIAYHPTRKTFFVTGKKWDKMFEVRIEKK